jgi:arylsulfatase A-like enzyme
MRFGFIFLVGWLISSGVFAAEKPNIIFILVDDLGKEWISCYGGAEIETPNIDRLAKTGIKFNNAYSMPQCTPSRVCFMTGQYPFRSGWVNHWDAPRWGVGYYDWRKNPSIARTLKAAGYKTAAAGKWQLNDFREQPDAMIKHGFDEYCMWTGAEGSMNKKHVGQSAQRYWNPYIHTKTGSKTYEGQFGPDIYNDFLLQFITENKDGPFFVYYPMTLTHSPLVHTPHEMKVTEKLDKHKAMVRYTDFLVGKLMDHLERLGLRKNTIIIWTCDNGTSGKISNMRNGRMVRGGKTQTTENGVNTPFIASCPSLIPQGIVSDALVDFTDMHSTFAALAGATLDPTYHYDGHSLKDVLLGAAKESSRKWIMAMGSHSGKRSEKGIENVYYFRDRVIREVRYKLFVGADRKPIKLVDVIKDPDEKIDLMGNPEYKGVLMRLCAVIESFPVQDNDPQYTPLPAKPWEKKATVKSQIHKVGYPGGTNTVKKSKSKNKRKRQ